MNKADEQALRSRLAALENELRRRPVITPLSVRPLDLVAAASKALVSIGSVSISGIQWLTNTPISSVPTLAPSVPACATAGLNTAYLNGSLVWVAFAFNPPLGAPRIDAPFQGHIPETVWFEALPYSIPCDAGGTSMVYLPKLGLW